MKFAQPLWLLAGLAVLVVLFWLYRRFDARQRASLADFASSHLLARLVASFSPGRRRLKRILFACSIGLIFIALARPEWGFHWEEQKRRGIDILFAIDTSKSMLTQDVNPDRLTRAKLAITDLVKKLDGDRVGLIAFAGDAFLQAPLTTDYDAFQESLDAIDVGVIPRGGTDISSAIQEAQAAFGQETANRKILVLLTDGEDLEAKGIDAARNAAKDGMTIYTVGVGSSAGGLIPVPGANGGTDFLKDASGQFVKSHLDENTLKQIAQVTGGLYEPLGQQGQGLVTLYNRALAPLPKQDLASRTQKVYDERFQWPLALGLVCLLASTLIGTRRSDRRRMSSSQRTSQAASIIGVFIVLTAFASSAQASPQSAEQAYKKGDFTVAEKQYDQAAAQHPQAAPLQFDAGAAAYKSSDYDRALPAFQKALNTDDVGVQQQAYYDLGNTQYRLGQKTEKSGPQETIKTWQSAIQSYDAALKLEAEDADAKFNRDFVQKKLDQLQKQQKQDQKQNQQDQKKDNQQSQQNQSQQQSSSSQNQQNNQANNQNQNQSKGGQASQQNQKQSSGSQQSQAQNGKENPQNQANQNPPQNQNGSQGQQGQPKNQQSGGQQTAGNQNQNSPQNGENQPNNSGTNQGGQLAQNHVTPAGPRGQTIPDKNPSNSQQPTGSEAENGTPGEMTRQEARDLLNSMKGNEHVLPVTADARNTANHSPDEQPLRDW
jgi:Ca-activated chloride channel family protein